MESVYGEQGKAAVAEAPASAAGRGRSVLRDLEEIALVEPAVCGEIEGLGIRIYVEGSGIRIYAAPGLGAVYPVSWREPRSVEGLKIRLKVRLPGWFSAG